MPIHYGDSKKIKEVYFGSYKIKAVHKGADLVWRSGPDVVYIIDPNDDRYPETMGVTPEEQLDIALAERGLSRATVTKIPFVIDLSKTKTADSLLFNCGNLTELPEIRNTDNITNANYMFAKCSNLKTIGSLSFANVSTAIYMFAQDLELTSVGPIKFSDKDVDLTYIFAGSDALVDNNVILTKPSWYDWWNSSVSNVSRLGWFFDYPPFYDATLDHIPSSIVRENTTESDIKVNYYVPKWAKYANLFMVSAGRAGQNGDGGLGRAGKGGGTGGMFIQSDIAVTASSKVSVNLARLSVSPSSGTTMAPNTNNTTCWIDDVDRNALGSAFWKEGISDDQYGTIIDYRIPSPDISKALLLGEYKSGKYGTTTWSFYNGTNDYPAQNQGMIGLQGWVSTGPAGVPNGGAGQFGAGGAGGNGGIFGSYTRGGNGGPSHIRLVFSSKKSTDW